MADEEKQVVRRMLQSNSIGPDETTPVEPLSKQSVEHAESVTRLQNVAVRSIEPGDPICEPMLHERARRKDVDENLRLALDRIQTTITANRQLTKKAVIALVIMVTMAAAEYLGLIGDGGPPIWAKAVIDALVAGVGAK